MTCQGQERKRKKPAQIVSPVFNSTTFTFFEEIIVWCNYENKVKKNVSSVFCFNFGTLGAWDQSF